MFAVKGKLTAYNPKFNSIELFKSPRTLYKRSTLQDSIALYKALLMAQSIYFNDLK